MSSHAPHRDDGPHEIMADDQNPSPSPSDEETVKVYSTGDEDYGLVEDLDKEAGEKSPDSLVATVVNGFSNRYRKLAQACHQASAETGTASGTASGHAPMHVVPRRSESPIESLHSLLDDIPSARAVVLSSSSSSVLPPVASRPDLGSPTPSLRPFDRRFQSRLSLPSLNPSRPSSPAFLSAHSRTGSRSRQYVPGAGESDSISPPWEVMRWSKLNKLGGQIFSELGKRNFGSPTCLVVSATIVVGTSKGIILIFDYSQSLKAIAGPGMKAAESGAISSLAISADHTTIAAGHENGNIFTWEISKAARPFLSIPHLDAAQMQNRTVDGHVPKAAITHVGFLGTRHTALVSADDRGMAFSHLATRGTGALGRTVKTSRILGRYPDSMPPSVNSPKPSTVLAFSPLPLGNVEMATDTMGLTAMLTPYLLVIVSSTPIAQTQYKSARPKEVAAHSAITGCLAWFPAVKLKVADPATASQVSKVKLVYCWSDVLTVLDLDEMPGQDKDKPPGLKFRPRSRWMCEEAIVSVQWLSRSVLAVLTISQRLIVLEDVSLRMTEAVDLIQKHVYHQDFFSKQLHALVEQPDEEDSSMHGVVADAFYMSFKAYKGRIFLLGFNDLSIGTLTNWAERLIALMEHGDYVGAIRLATAYYTGDADKLTVGLPEDTNLRYSMVREKVVEIMRASLKYVFGQRQKDAETATDSHLQELTETCLVACQRIAEMEFLFGEMYEFYDDGDARSIFLESLESYILSRTIIHVPAVVVKAMVSHYVAKGWESRLEDLICQMDTATLDLNEVTKLFKEHSLYEASMYVWNQAMGDFITPLMDLLDLLVPPVVPPVQDGEAAGSSNVSEKEKHGPKIFYYLSHALTGRAYPTGEMMPDEVAQKAKAELYWFLFSGKSIVWPKGSGKRFVTRPFQSEEPSFPYLRIILRFDAPSFLASLNEAFEDSFLNTSPEKQLDGDTSRDLPEEQVFGLTVDRQYIVSILMEIMHPADFSPEESIYLDMFIARNLPKYPQYLLFPGATMTRVLTGLCNYPGSDLAEDAQLSAEYLLSIYRPPDLAQLIPHFERAAFYRILKQIYKADKRYGKLVLTFFEDPNDRDSIFSCIQDCLRPESGPNRRQIQEVHRVIKDHASALIELDAGKAARTIAYHAPELHHYILESVTDRAYLQYAYLRSIVEPEETAEYRALPDREPDRELIERYVQLMCTFDPAHVSDFVSLIQPANLRLERLLPTMEESSVIDAAVVLMAREGQVQEAMGRLVKHLKSLESALQALLGSTESGWSGDALQTAAEELFLALQKYSRVGIWLCQGQTRTIRDATHVRRRQKSAAQDELAPDEAIWLQLIETCVQITQRISAGLQRGPEQSETGRNGDATAHDARRLIDVDKLLTLLRSLVQYTFTALLTSTSTPAGAMTRARQPPPALGLANNLSFLRIFRAFLTRAAASSPSLRDLRAVLASVFSAYAHEESILRLSSRLLEGSLFVSLSQAVELRQRGWRPRGSTCDACGRRIWGPGVTGNVFGAWEEQRAKEVSQRERTRAPSWLGPDEGRIQGRGEEAVASDLAELCFAGGSKGKGKDTSRELNEQPKSSPQQDGDGNGEQAVSDDRAPRLRECVPAVIFACRHIYHKSCLVELQSIQGQGDEARYWRKIGFRCPMDG